jgi:ELWxxDGT repeat protein
MRGITLAIAASLLAAAATAQSLKPFDFGSKQNLMVLATLGELEGSLLVSTFCAKDGLRVRITDGTSTGSTIAGVDHFDSLFMPGHNPEDILRRGTSAIGYVFYYFRSHDGVELWRTDGSEDGNLHLWTWTVSSSEHWPQSLIRPAFAELSGLVYFSGVAGSFHRTDGTPAGTEELAATDFNVMELRSFAGTLLLSIGGPGGIGLSVSDGTVPGTTSLIPAGDFVRLLGELNGQYYFAVTNSSLMFELWRTDGTPAGTTLVAQLRGSVPNQGYDAWYYRFTQHAVVMNGLLFFLVESPVFWMNLDLWRTDGTETGTTYLARHSYVWEPGTFPEQPVGTPHHGLLRYFTLETDGTPEATKFSGFVFHRPESMLRQYHIHGNQLLVTATKDVQANSYAVEELWSVDLTDPAAEARLVRDFSTMTTHVGAKVRLLGSVGDSVLMAVQTDAGTRAWILSEGTSGSASDESGCSLGARHPGYVLLVLLFLAALRRLVRRGRLCACVCFLGLQYCGYGQDA